MTLAVRFDLPDGRSIAVHDGVRSDLLGDLAHEILERETKEPQGQPSINRGGWKSGEIVFGSYGFGGACFSLGETLQHEYLGGGFPVGWAMVNRDGNYHPRHTHYRPRISGVYYVTAGQAPGAPTILETPGGKHGEQIQIDPAPGRLVLFPGDLWHRVPEVRGATPRIAIAFDVRG